MLREPHAPNGDLFSRRDEFVAAGIPEEVCRLCRRRAEQERLACMRSAAVTAIAWAGRRLRQAVQIVAGSGGAPGATVPLWARFRQSIQRRPRGGFYRS